MKLTKTKTTIRSGKQWQGRVNPSTKRGKERRDATPRRNFHPCISIKWNCSDENRHVVFDKIWLLLGYFYPLCVHCSSCVSTILPHPLHPEVLSSYLFSPYFFPLSSISRSKENDGNPRSVERFGSIAFPFRKVFFLSFKRVISSI